MPEFKKTIGTKAEVWKGIAKRTSGGLHKKDILRKAVGRLSGGSGKRTYRYVSKAKSAKPMNAYFTLMLEAKRRGLDEFTYNGNRYVKTTLSTGLETYRKM